MQATELKQAVVLGAGQMGAGIAQVMAVAGINVKLYDLTMPQVQRGLRGIEKGLQRLHEKGRLTEPVAAISGRIQGIDTLEAADGAEFVVEAVVENEAAKVEIFRKLHTILPPRPFFLPTPRASASPAWGPKPGARPSSWACTS